MKLEQQMLLSYIAVMTKEEIPIILSEMGKDEKEIKKLLK